MEISCMKVSTARKKLIPAAPGPLVEKAHELIAEVLTASSGQQREIIEAWRDALDQALDDLAERIRPKGEMKTDSVGNLAVVGSVPAGYLRIQFDDRSKGSCACRAYLKEALDA
jgi:hypothetical protein